MKTILVTGSRGFIGKHLCRHLDHLGHHVIEADKELGFDLCDPNDTQYLPEVDIVVHLAAFNGTKYFYQLPYDVIRTNILSTQNILDRYAGKVERIVFSGSCESYAGAIDVFDWPVPTAEDVPLVIPQITNPRWSYGGSKLVNELQIISAGLQLGQSYSIIRYHNVYGPGQKDHFIPEFIDRAKNGLYYLDGWNNTRSFMYISDAVDATVDIIFSNRCKNEIIHVGVNDQRTIKEVAEMILEEMGINVDLVLNAAPSGSVSKREPDIKKLIELLGFHPKIDLRQGIKKLL
jgi:nucleoside-diphosphate-sugar epimerase